MNVCIYIGMRVAPTRIKTYMYMYIMYVHYNIYPVYTLCVIHCIYVHVHVFEISAEYWLFTALSMYMCTHAPTPHLPSPVLVTQRDVELLEMVYSNQLPKSTLSSILQQTSDNNIHIHVYVHVHACIIHVLIYAVVAYNVGIVFPYPLHIHCTV